MLGPARPGPARIVADDVISNTAAAEHVAASFPARAQLARRAAQWQAGAEVAFTLDDALAAVALAEAHRERRRDPRPEPDLEAYLS
jgi:hypothetical protein